MENSALSVSMSGGLNSSVQLTLRCLSAMLVFIYAIALYAEWHIHLSLESLLYQEQYPDAIREGLSFLYIFAKIFAAIGSVSGIYGAALIIFFEQRGLRLVAWSAPLIAFAACLLAPQSNYPSVEPILVLLLWCASSATWAAVVTLAWVMKSNVTVKSGGQYPAHPLL